MKNINKQNIGSVKLRIVIKLFKEEAFYANTCVTFPNFRGSVLGKLVLQRNVLFQIDIPHI